MCAISRLDRVMWTSPVGRSIAPSGCSAGRRRSSCAPVSRSRSRGSAASSRRPRPRHTTNRPLPQRADEMPTGSVPAAFHEVIAERRLIAVTADPALAGYLREICGPRALFLAPPWAAERVRATGADVLDFHGPEQLARTDTDVLVLDTVGRLPGLRFRDLSRAAHVAVVRRRMLPAPGANRIRHDRMRGRLSSVGHERLALGQRTAHIEVFSVKSRAAGGPRRWFSPVLGVGGLLHLLTEAEVRYVVLRWFDDLPNLPPGEDLDLLIDDADLPMVDRIFADRPGTEPCDVYTVTGLPRSDLHGMAYLPPDLAAATLRDAVVMPGGFRVPAPEHAFLTLAYHAAYHKGPGCGLPSDAGSPAGEAIDHDYASALG